MTTHGNGYQQIPQLILADPAWHFQNYAGDTPDQVIDRGHGAQRHYPTMSIEDICALTPPVADNAILLLWACWPLLPEALKVISAWGFEYKTLAWVWVKSNPFFTGFYMGMGYWTRSNSEICLLATRGKGLPRKRKDVMSLIYSPIRQHSRKPDEQYTKIDRLFGTDIVRLEMFARHKQPGWLSWGNEVESDIEIGITTSEIGVSE